MTAPSKPALGLMLRDPSSILADPTNVEPRPPANPAYTHTHTHIPSELARRNGKPPDPVAGRAVNRIGIQVALVVDAPPRRLVGAARNSPAVGAAADAVLLARHPLAAAAKDGIRACDDGIRGRGGGGRRRGADTAARRRVGPDAADARDEGAQRDQEAVRALQGEKRLAYCLPGDGMRRRPRMGCVCVCVWWTRLTLLFFFAAR